MSAEERVKEIYRKYIDVICPYILEYEVVSGSFPIAILNEIRAIFTHISKYYLSGDDKINEGNLSKAERHIKRTILDCYKYICIAYDDEYKEFEKKYKRIDLSLIDNGEFLSKLLEFHNTAVNLTKEARKTDYQIDSDNESKNDESYNKYQKAYNAYSLVHDLINNSYKKLEFFKKRATFKDFLSISGWVIGIIGIILTIISFVL